MHQEVFEFEVFMVLQLASLMSVHYSYLEFLCSDRPVDLIVLRPQELAHVFRDEVLLIFLQVIEFFYGLYKVISRCQSHLLSQ